MSAGERWRWVVGYEGLYMVSDQGEIIAVPHGYKDGVRLKLEKAGNGYIRVSLYKDGAYKKPGVHRVVAEAFIPKRKPSVIALDYGVTRQCIADIQKRKFYKEVI